METSAINDCGGSSPLHAAKFQKSAYDSNLCLLLRNFYTIERFRLINMDFNNKHTLKAAQLTKLTIATYIIREAGN